MNLLEDLPPKADVAPVQSFVSAALLSLEIGDFSMAERIARHADSLDRSLPHGRLVLVMVALRRQDAANGQALLDEIVVDFPGHPLVRLIASNFASDSRCARSVHGRVPPRPTDRLTKMRNAWSLRPQSKRTF